MPKCLLLLALAGAILSPGGAGASEAPGVESCAATAPRFEPKLRKRPAPEAVRFLGGARVSHPVGAPCLRRAGEAQA